MSLKEYKKFKNPAGDTIYSLKDEFKKDGRVTPIALTIKESYNFDGKKIPAYYSVAYYLTNKINRKMQNKQFKTKKELMEFVKKLSMRK